MLTLRKSISFFKNRHELTFATIEYFLLLIRTPRLFLRVGMIMQVSTYSYHIAGTCRKFFRSHWSRSVDFVISYFWGPIKSIIEVFGFYKVDTATLMASKTISTCPRDVIWVLGGLQMTIPTRKSKREGRMRRRKNSIVANVSSRWFFKNDIDLLNVRTGQTSNK